MFKRRPLPREAWPSGLGPAWRELLEQLDQALRALDPECFIWAVDVDAQLHARICAPAHVRDQAQALARETARRSATMCETCGHPGRARAGAVVTVRCPDC